MTLAFLCKNYDNIIETIDGFAKTIGSKNYPIVFDYRPTLVGGELKLRAKTTLKS